MFFIGKVKNFLHKTKRKIYQYPKNYFKNIFWEENEDNMYYGHYHIIRNYTNSVLPFKLNGELQHGWHETNGMTCPPQLHSKLQKNQRYYLWNSRNIRYSIEDGYQNVIAIGAPFLYMEKLKINKQNNGGLILFPIHAQEYYSFKNPLIIYKNYINELKKIKHLFKFITVSLYWYEYQNKKIISMFKDVGFNVISMGHRDDNIEFLYNFRNIVLQHEYLSSDSFCSAVFYGLFLKRKTFLYGSSMYEDLDIPEVWNTEKKVEKYGIYYDNLFRKKYPQLIWKNFDSEIYYDIGVKELGYENKRSKKELREIFEWKLKNIFMPL